MEQNDTNLVQIGASGAVLITQERVAEGFFAITTANPSQDLSPEEVLGQLYEAGLPVALAHLLGGSLLVLIQSVRDSAKVMEALPGAADSIRKSLMENITQYFEASAAIVRVYFETANDPVTHLRAVEAVFSRGDLRDVPPEDLVSSIATVDSLGSVLRGVLLNEIKNRIVRQLEAEGYQVTANSSYGRHVIIRDGGSEDARTRSQALISEITATYPFVLLKIQYDYSKSVSDPLTLELSLLKNL